MKNKFFISILVIMFLIPIIIVLPISFLGALTLLIYKLLVNFFWLILWIFLFYYFIKNDKKNVDNKKE